jgi:hypothetical protein
MASKSPPHQQMRVAPKARPEGSQVAPKARPEGRQVAPKARLEGSQGQVRSTPPLDPLENAASPGGAIDRAHRRILSALRASFEFARSQGAARFALAPGYLRAAPSALPVAPPGLAAFLTDPGAACFALAPGYLRAAPSALPVGPSALPGDLRAAPSALPVGPSALPGDLRVAPSALHVGPSVPLPTFGPRLRRYLSALRRYLVQLVLPGGTGSHGVGDGDGAGCCCSDGGITAGLG